MGGPRAGNKCRYERGKVARDTYTRCAQQFPQTLLALFRLRSFHLRLGVDHCESCLL